MTDHDALIDAILANRDDDTPRLVYADWLDENGQSERGEFVRVQVELAKYGTYTCGKGELKGLPIFYDKKSCGCKWCGFRRRQRKLLVAPRIGEWAGQELRPLWVDRVAERTLYGRRELPEYPFEFTRGFVSMVECEWFNWYANSAAILKNHPIERVKLTTRPDFRIDSHESRVIATMMWSEKLNPLNVADWSILRQGGPTPDAAIKECLKYRWPRIEFELPPERINLYEVVWDNLRRGMADNIERYWGDLAAAENR